MAQMTLGILGAGNVGTALGRGWSACGHRVLYGVRDPQDARHQGALADAPGAQLLTLQEAIQQADVIVLAVSWKSIEEVLTPKEAFAGKIVIDATNPLGFEGGVISLLHGFTTSGGEIVQSLIPGAYVFKAMNQVSYEVMDKTKGYPARPVMFVAGSHGAQKLQVLALVGELGFDARDAGPLESARFLEPLGMVVLEQYVTYGASTTNAFAFMVKHDAQEVIEYVRYQLTTHTPDIFLEVYGRACTHLGAAPECLSYEMTQCAEDPASFVLRIRWKSAKDHLEGFRKGPHFPPFLQAIGPFIQEITEMRHYHPTPLVYAG